MSHLKIDKEIIMYCDTEIENHEFHRDKNPIFLIDVNIDHIITSNRVYFGEKNSKYFIGVAHEYSSVPMRHIGLLSHCLI